jgi:hypothetical protein
MAYRKGDLEKKALKIIEAEKLFFHSDVWPFLGISERTYYNHKLQELQTIKEALERNKVLTKSSLRSKWYDSSSAALQLALYKLIATPEEVERLSMQNVKQRIEETLRIEPAFEVDYSALSDSALQEIAEATKPRQTG